MFRISKLCSHSPREYQASPSGTCVVQTTSTVVQRAMDDPKRGRQPKGVLISRYTRRKARIDMSMRSDQVASNVQTRNQEKWGI